MSKEFYIELDTFRVKLDTKKRNKKAFKEREQKSKNAREERQIDRMAANYFRD